MKVYQVKWSDEHSGLLDKALGIYVEEIKHEVETGVCQLWKVETKGYVVTRIEGNTEPEELVMVAGQGKDYVEVLTWFIVNIANPLNLSVRVHAIRKGIERFIKQTGFNFIKTFEDSHETIFHYYGD